MKEVPKKATNSRADETLAKFRRQNERAWKHILGMSDVLDKEFVELSLAGEDNDGFDPYDSSVRLRRLSA